MKQLIILLVCIVAIHGITIPNFIPFGLEEGDTALAIVDDDSSPPFQLSVNFPFFNQSFSQMYVTSNGLISFGAPFRNYVPFRFPLSTFTGVAPFWTDIDIREGGMIYYRQIASTSQIRLLDMEIRRAFPSFYNYRSTVAFVASYYQVAGFGIENLTRDTFQAVICTNGRYSFTIFNYFIIEWFRASTTPNGAQAGFNAGDGVNYHVINGSFTSDVVSLVNETNVDIPGKWIFRIDQADIEDGGCPETGFVSTKPNSVFVFGGDHVSISGPCFQSTDLVEMRFRHDTSIVINCDVADSTFVLCNVPFLNNVGRYEFDIGINGNFSFQGM